MLIHSIFSILSVNCYARQYPRDNAEAAGEAAVRAISTANYWTSEKAAHATFCTIYVMVAGSAWKVDQDRFDSVQDTALDVAVGVDPIIYYAFEPSSEYSWKKPPFDDITEEMWGLFLKVSGMTVAEWVEVAKNVDYQTASLENTALIKTYTRAYNNILDVTTDAASKIRRI